MIVCASIAGQCHGSMRLFLPRDEQKEGSIKKMRLALTARATLVLAIYPNCVGIGSIVRSIAPGSWVAAGSHHSSCQRVRLNPSAPAIDCFYVLSERDDIVTETYPTGLRDVAAEATRHAAG
jgi:hypothetical protein